MAFIKQIKINDRFVSVYKMKNGTVVHALKDKIPGIASRTRTIKYDETGMPVKCNDIRLRKGVLLRDQYIRSTDGKTVLIQNGEKKSLDYLDFVNLVDKFFK